MIKTTQTLSARPREPLSAHLRALSGKFHELQFTGAGMTREDIEIIGREVREMTRRAREMEGESPRRPINEAVPTAFNLLDQAEHTICEARRALFARIQEEAVDPAETIRGQLSDAAALVTLARGVITGERAGDPSATRRVRP